MFYALYHRTFDEEEFWVTFEQAEMRGEMLDAEYPGSFYTILEFELLG